MNEKTRIGIYAYRGVIRVSSQSKYYFAEIQTTSFW